MDIKKKILSDPLIKWVFDNSPKETYLVGGYIRDLLRGEMPEDKDFVLKGNAEKIAKKAAKMFGGKVIDLHNKQTFRVAPKGRMFIDFSALKNEIMVDLQSRDFTINAIAWSPGSGIMSPDKYMEDVENRMVRHIKPQNLLDDPLRILRAYRLAAQLDFKIQIDTRGLLEKYSKKIESAAPERITEELFKLLNCENALNYIKLCALDNVLSRLLLLTDDNIDINLHSIKAYDRFIQKYVNIHNRTDMNTYLSTELSQGLKKYGFIRCYLLLRKFNNKAQRTCSTGTRSEILKENNMLRFSTRIQKSLYYMERAESMCRGRITDRRLYQIFTNAGDCIRDIAIIQSIIKPSSHCRIITKAEEFLHKRNNTLINGRDIKKILGIDSGMVIGEIKEKVCENHFLGNIRNRRDAREFIIHNFT
jgi:tRNA nucleotidyltransferase/poly(A) polymerase